jgi:hypothetical protein
VLDVLPWDRRYLAHDAMPDAFYRKQNWNDNRWYTYRKGDASDSGG